MWRARLVLPWIGLGLVAVLAIGGVLNDCGSDRVDKCPAGESPVVVDGEFTGECEEVTPPPE